MQKRDKNIILVLSVIIIISLGIILSITIYPEWGGVPTDSPYLNLIDSPDTDGTIELSWSWVYGADGYRVYRDGVNIVLETTELSYTDSGLTDGTYHYKVRAYNVFGSSPYSNEQWVIVCLPGTNPPEAPTLNDIQSPNRNGIIYLAWNFVDGADSYTVVRTGTKYKSVEGITATTYTDSGLTDGTYNYRIRARNVAGYSGYSNEETVIVEFLTVPDAPSLNPIDSPNLDGNIYISWSSIEGVTYYNIYCSRVGGSFTKIREGCTESHYTDIGLNDGTYLYKITAINDIGESGYSNTETVTVEIGGNGNGNGNGNGDIPDAPVQYHLPDYDYDGEINLQWFIVSDADSYNIYRSSDGISFNKVASGITENTYTDSCGDIGIYYYKITAVNTNGESGFSDVESIEVVEVEEEDLTGIIILLIIVIAIGITSIYVARKLRKKVR